MSLRRVSGGCWWFFVVCLTKTEKKGEREREKNGRKWARWSLPIFLYFLGVKSFQKSFFFYSHFHWNHYYFVSFIFVCVCCKYSGERKKEELEKCSVFLSGLEERRKKKKKKKRMAFLRNAHIFLFFVRVRRGRRELLKVEKKKSRQQIGAGRENKRRTFPESYFHSEWMG